MHYCTVMSRSRFWEVIGQKDTKKTVFPTNGNHLSHINTMNEKEFCAWTKVFIMNEGIVKDVSKMCYVWMSSVKKKVSVLPKQWQKENC